ncbi:putative pentatricopeptide repeat-containing protein At1g03510 [Silene latifolia]|uniref:putative pentatricopeptide repeat-containing protein At1g03510 n=1 Tax=Silene latifolia TaxID=37657 RepID=UPI003D77F667
MYCSDEGFVIRSLNHFTSTKNLKEVKKLHGHLLRRGSFFSSFSIFTKLIFSCTSIQSHKSNQILTSFFSSMNFCNPLPFNMLLADFCQNGLPVSAIKTCSLMHTHGIPLDTYALCSSLTAASSVKAVSFGKQVHAHLGKSGWSSSVFLGSAVVGLYSRSLFINDAEKAFIEIPMKNSFCVNALLAGYSEAKLWARGIEMIRQMPQLSLNYDYFTLTAALCACAGLYATSLGKQVHGYVLRTTSGLETDIVLLSSLIEMYGRCGSIVKALQVFNLSGLEFGLKQKRDVVLWTSMLGLYGRNGNYPEVIRLYHDMLREGVRPDKVAFVTVISACAHTGQVDLGLSYFKSMKNDFNLEPGQEHYSCLVDLLSRAGELERALEVVSAMPCKGHDTCVSLWGALLNACKERGNISLAKMVVKKALELDPQNAGVMALLSNTYAKLGMWDETEALTILMKEQGMKKDAGCSWV